MASKTKYFKYHRDENKKTRIFDPELFSRAQVVLLKVSPRRPPRVFFVEDQSRKNNTQTVGSFDMPERFEIPDKAKEISQKAFKRMAG